MEVPALRAFNPIVPLIAVTDLDYQRFGPMVYGLSVVVSQALIFTTLWFWGRVFSSNWRDDDELEYWTPPSYTTLPVPPMQPTPATTTGMSTESKHHHGWGAPKWFDGNPVT